MIYFVLSKVFMHLAQANTRLPARGLNFLCFVSLGMLSHCKFGYLRLLAVGLYFPLNFLRTPKTRDPFPHIAHCFAICYDNIIFFIKMQIKWFQVL